MKTQVSFLDKDNTFYTLVARIDEQKHWDEEERFSINFTTQNGQDVPNPKTELQTEVVGIWKAMHCKAILTEEQVNEAFEKVKTIFEAIQEERGDDLVSNYTPEELRETLLTLEDFDETEVEKIHALGVHLELTVDECESITFDDDTRLSVGSKDYLVCTDDEADELMAEEVERSIWAFMPSFLIDYASEGVSTEVFSILQEKCEDANEAIKALVNWNDNKEQIISDAISADGRGCFLSHYNGNEYKEGEYFIYYS